MHANKAGFKRSVWVSVNKELCTDAVRDVNDLLEKGEKGPRVMNLNELDFSKIDSSKNRSHFHWDGNGILYTYGFPIQLCCSLMLNFFYRLRRTYHLMVTENGSNKKRLKQIIDWMRGDSDGGGCVVFDEAHKAKNLVPDKGTKPTKIGMAVQKLQADLPNARVLYASATGCSEIRHLAYMSRLGLWDPRTAFKNWS